MNWYTEYRNSLKMPEVEELFDLFFYRPLAFLLVKLVYRTPITPNQLTIAAIVAGIAAGCFYAEGSPAYVAYGAVLFLLHNIIDCSDGQLARLKKNGTRAGRIIDGLADYISRGAVFIGLGIGHADHQYSLSLWWLLVVITGISNLIHAALLDYYHNRFLDHVLQRKNTFEEDLDAFKEEYNAMKGQKNKWLDRFIILAYFEYLSLQTKITGKKEGEKLFQTTPQDYYQRNRVAVKFWTLIGPSSQATALIICSFIHRFDIYFWAMIAGFNAITAVLWLIQRNIDKTFELQDASGRPVLKQY